MNRIFEVRDDAARERIVRHICRLLPDADFQAFLEFLQVRLMNLDLENRSVTNDVVVRHHQGAAQCLQQLLEYVDGARDSLLALTNPQSKKKS